MLLLVVLVALVAGLVAFLVMPGRIEEPQRAQAARLYGHNCAHRGLHTPDRSVPENSLVAFRAAVEAGYGIELDIQLSRDGQVVVFHDDDLSRVCGVQGRVDAYDWADLQGMRLEGSEERIPLFADLLALVAGRVPLIVELKMGPRNAELCRKACEQLRAYDGPFCVESFDPRILRWFRLHATEFLRGQLSARPSHLGSSLAGFLVGNLLTNFLARPHFIAYQIGRRPLLVRAVRRRAMRVAWTASPQNFTPAVENENDAVIFEFYSPPPQYKQPE